MLKRFAIVLLVGVSLASAKTYTFTLSNATQAATAQLKPGDYTIKLDGTQVRLLDRSGHEIEFAAKVEPADRKFSRTAIAISTEDGSPKIVSIQLGRTNNKSVFQ